MVIDKKERLQLRQITKVQDTICYRKKTKAVWSCWHAVIDDKGFPKLLECIKRFKLQYHATQLYRLQTEYHEELKTLYTWVILNSNGMYVRAINPNVTHKVSSFCTTIKLAKKFNSREQALKDCCGNENPVSPY